MNRLKQRKALVFALAILGVLIVILLITLATKSNTPTPGPAPGPTPTPDGVWNPYKLESLYAYDKSRVFGSIQLQNPTLKSVADGPKVIKASPKTIPTGNNNKLSNVA